MTTEEQHDDAVQDALNAFDATDLVQALMTRGVIRACQLNRVIPGVVIRQSQIPHDRLVEMEKASAVHSLIAELVRDGAILTEVGHPGPDFAPSDLRVSAQVMYIKPGVV